MASHHKDVITVYQISKDDLSVFELFILLCTLITSSSRPVHNYTERLMGVDRPHEDIQISRGFLGIIAVEAHYFESYWDSIAKLCAQLGVLSGIICIPGDNHAYLGVSSLHCKK